MAERRVVLEHCGAIDPSDIASYVRRDGFLALKKARTMGPEAIIAEMAHNVFECGSELISVLFFSRSQYFVMPYHEPPASAPSFAFHPIESAEESHYHYLRRSFELDGSQWFAKCAVCGGPRQTAKLGIAEPWTVSRLAEKVYSEFSF